MKVKSNYFERNGVKNVKFKFELFWLKFCFGTSDTDTSLFCIFTANIMPESVCK